MFRGHDRRYHHRHPSFADTGAGVVIAAEFRKMCLPRNPATTTPSRSATTSIATAVIATRLPRPILTFLTIWSIAVSFSMSRSAASTVPMELSNAPAGQRLHILRNWPQAAHSRCLRQRRGRASASKAALQLTDNCRWVTVLPQARPELALLNQNDGQHPSI